SRRPSLAARALLFIWSCLRSPFTSVSSKGPQVTLSDTLGRSHEGEEALAGHEALRPCLGEARLLDLRHEFVRHRQRAAAYRRRRPEVEQVHHRTPALTAGGDEQPPAGAKEAAHVAEERTALRDAEVVDVVVQRREVEGGLSGAMPHVADLEGGAGLETPSADVLPGRRRPLRLERDRGCVELRVPRRGPPNVDPRAAADLEQPNRAARRDH